MPNRQSLCRAAPGLKSHNTRAKVGYVEGNFEKQVPGPATLSVTKRTPCAITRGPDHTSWHMRARPCMALNAPGPRQGMEHTAHGLCPPCRAPSPHCALHSARSTHCVCHCSSCSCLLNLLCHWQVKNMQLLSTAVLRAIRNGQDTRKTCSGTPVWQSGGQVSVWHLALKLSKCLNVWHSFTILTRVFLLSTLQEVVDKKLS